MKIKSQIIEKEDISSLNFPSYSLNKTPEEKRTTQEEKNPPEKKTPPRVCDEPRQTARSHVGIPTNIQYKFTAGQRKTCKT